MSLLTPIGAEQWDAVKARHLLNRAGFGVPQERVAGLARLTPKRAVSSLVDYAAAESPPSAPEFLVPVMSYPKRRELFKDMTEDERRDWNRENQGQERAALNALRGWWFERMLYSRRPLEEKMTLFWHGHFATSAQKVKQSLYNYQLNEIFRSHAVGDFKALTEAVGQSPAMLQYLDNKQSSKRKPNENWARELMELFTMGRDQYTEEDIKESARAFTGWTCDHEKFVYNKGNHDTGEKTFLGRTGNFDGWDILDIIFEQPVTAEFICGKLWAYFAYPDPEAEVVQGLAKTFRERGYQVAPVLRQLFASEAFYSERAVATQIKSPVQFMVQLCDDLAVAQPPCEFLAQAAGQLGQNIFYPPNVKGWDGNRAWIDSNTLLARYNQPQRLSYAVFQQLRKKPEKEEGMEGAMMQEGPIMEKEGEMRRKDGAAAQPGPIPVAALSAKERQRRAEEKVREMLEAMPPQERRKRLQEFAKADLDGKMKMLKRLGIDIPLGEASPLASVFEHIEFNTGGECVNALLSRFLVTPVSQGQRAALLEVLGIGNPRAPLALNDLSYSNREAAVHLITSMAEYQLC